MKEGKKPNINLVPPIFSLIFSLISPIFSLKFIPTIYYTIAPPRSQHLVIRAIDPRKMGDDNQFLKQMGKSRSDFMEHFDAKVNHILEMITSIQQQLQMQEMTNEEGNGDDFQAMESYTTFEKTNIFVHESSFLTKETTEVEEHKLFDEMHAPEIMVVDVSEIGEMKLEIKIEENEVRERFVEVLNHAPIITTVAKLLFGEIKFEVMADLQLEESTSELEVLPKLPLVVSLHSVAIESSKNNDAQKVFDELIRRDLNPLREVSAFVDLGKEIYIYIEENIVKNESTDATLNVCFEMKDIESIMNFDPGGDSKVFDSYKKLFYIEELVLLQNWSNSQRSLSLSFCFISGNLMHTHMEISRRFVGVFVGSEWVESYARLLNINGVAMVFDDNSPWIATLFGIMDVPKCKNDVVCLKNSGFCEIAIPHHEHVKLVGKKHSETHENFGKVHDIFSCSFDDISLNDMDLFMKVLDVFKACGTEMVDNFLDVVMKSLTSVGKMKHLPSVRRENQTVVLSFMEPNAIYGAILVLSFEKKSDRIIMCFNFENNTLVLAIFSKGLAYGLPKFVVDRSPKLIGIGVRNQIDVSVVILTIDENSQTYKADKVFVGMVDVIFFNVAQSDQERMFVLNASYFLKAEGHFIVSIKANYTDSIVLAKAVSVAEVKILQAEHFKPTEMVTLEPFEQDPVCGWIKMLNRFFPKPTPQFRYLRCEDSTHSREYYSCGNGRVWVWRFGRGRVIGGAEVGSPEASWLGHFNRCFQNLIMKVSSLDNIRTLLHLNPRGNPIAEKLGNKLWECLREFIIPTTLKDYISNLVLFGLHGIIGAMLKPLFHELCAGAIWSFLMAHRLDYIEKIDEPQVSYVTDELDSPLLHSVVSNFRIPHSICLSEKLRSAASHSLLIPTENVQSGGAWMKVLMLVRPSPKPPFQFRHLSRGDTTLRGASIVVRMEHGEKDELVVTSLVIGLGNWLGSIISFILLYLIKLCLVKSI